MESRTFKGRLKILMNGEPPYRWAKKVGIYKGLFQYYWQNEKIPTADNLIKIQNYTGCSLDWLITGRLATLDYKVTELKFSRPERNSGAIQRRFVAAFGNLKTIFERGSPADRGTIENILSHMAHEK